jgi:hypothetical protein
MKHAPSHWLWKGLIPPQSCQDIIDLYFTDEKKQQAKIDSTEEGEVNTEARSTEVCWIPQNESISLLLLSKALIANNKAGWGFDIEGSEDVQLGRYGVGGHYDWHTDETYYNRLKTWHRKVSVVAFLSDPTTYAGGEFMFPKIEIPSEQGTVLCFPSEIRHKVMPVTEGVRYSLVSWATGPLMR